MNKNLFVLLTAGFALPFLVGCSFDEEETSHAPSKVVYNVTSLDEFKETMAKIKYNESKAAVKCEVNIEGDIDFNGEGQQYKISSATVNGNGHALKNYNIAVTSNGGLFSQTYYCDFNGLKISNANVIGNTAGGLVGKGTYTAINGVSTDSTVTVGDGSGDNIGGIIGFASYGSVTGSTNEATVKGANGVGGVVGYAKNNNMKSNSNKGDVTCYNGSGAGGIVGNMKTYWNYDRHVDTFSENSNQGHVKGIVSNYIGGIIGAFIPEVDGLSTLGDLASGTEKQYPAPLFEKSSNSGLIEGVDGVGGVIGGISENTLIQPTVSMCTNNGTVKGRRYVGGVMGISAEFETDFIGCKNLANEAKDNYVEGNYFVGGIAGKGRSASSCENHATVRLTKANDVIEQANNSPVYYTYQYAIGGIFGFADTNGTVNPGSFINNKNAGLISGYYDTDSDACSKASCAGGIVGLSYGGSFIGNENSGKIDARNCSGGIVGTLVAKCKTTFTSQTSTGDLNLSLLSGGIVGYIYLDNTKFEKVTLTSCTVDIEEAKLQFGGDEYSFGGLIGAVATTSNHDSYFEKISILESSVSVKYYSRSGDLTVRCEPVIGVNPVSNGGKYAVIIDAATTSASLVTRLGDIQ